MSDKKDQIDTPVEIITDVESVRGEVPVLSVKTGRTNNQTFYVRIKQPAGRATLIAMHL